jgi:hypothetical protein
MKIGASIVFGRNVIEDPISKQTKLKEWTPEGHHSFSL